MQQSPAATLHQKMNKNTSLPPEHDSPAAHARVPQSKRQARAWFSLRGIEIKAWAQAHGFHPAMVYSMLETDRLKGTRGQSHNIAVLLGIKRGQTNRLYVPPQQRTGVEDAA